MVLNLIEQIFTMFGQILSLLDIFPDASGMGLVFEYMPCTLHTKIKDPIHRLSRSAIRSYMKMLLEGLSYMHNLGILHRVRNRLDSVFCFVLFNFV